MGDNCCIELMNEKQFPPFMTCSVTLALCTYKQPFCIVLQGGWWHCLALIGGNNYQKGLVIGLIVIRSTLHWLALVHLRTSQKVTRPKPFLTWVTNDEVMVKTPNPKNNHEYRDRVQLLGWIWLPWGKALFPPTALLQKVFGQYFWMIHATSCQTSPSWIETGRQRQKLALQQDLDRHRNFI